MMVLGNSHRVLLQGDRAHLEEVFQVWKVLANEESPDRQLKKNPIYVEAKRSMDEGILDRQLLRDLKLVDTKQRLLEITAPRGGEPIIEMDGVRVQYGDKVVLGNWKQKVKDELRDGLHWKVRRGQRWAIIGANGSGKTTLLSLITYDHPQAYALPVRLFGRSRLPEPGKPGISIFELQSRIGHSSPEIHAFFPRNLTIRQAVESAFANTFLSKPRLDHEKDLDVSAALRFFRADLDPEAATGGDPSTNQVKGNQMAMFPKLPNYKPQRFDYKVHDYEFDYADSLRFSSLNVAQQRLVLFIRALVHKPDLVILDEAFSGMPASLRDKCLHFLEAGELKRNHVSTATRRTTAADTWLNEATVEASKARHKGLSDQQALLVISHVREEIPDSVRHWVRLPSDLGVGEPLDFKMGVLGYDSTLGGEAWNAIWSHNGTEKSRRTWRRRDNDVDKEERDEDIYEYFTL
jgi:ABC-type molybdenum transport system ATPase subunit/photorepair protein PhrA